MKIATLEAEVLLTTSDFNKGIDNVSEDLNKIKKELDGFDERVTASSGVMARAWGEAIGESINDVISESIEIISEFVTSSIDLAEKMDGALRRSDNVFGAQSSRVKEWALTTKDSFGIASSEALDFATRFGTILQGTNLPADQIARMSMNLTEMIGDLAAFQGMSIDTVFEKVISGLRGETEAIEDLGIDVRASALAAYAGISETAFGKLSYAERMLITYRAIADQAKGAQGYFKDNNDSYAAQLNLLQANISELKTALGTSLLPVITDLVGWFNTLFGSTEEAEGSFSSLAGIATQSFTDVAATAEDARALAETLVALQESGEGAANPELWNSIVAQLSATIPGIETLIGNTTGTIEAGAEALDAYIENYRRLALETARVNAMAEYNAELAVLERAVVEAQAELRKAPHYVQNYGSQMSEIVDMFGRAWYAELGLEYTRNRAEFAHRALQGIMHEQVQRNSDGTWSIKSSADSYTRDALNNARANLGDTQFYALLDRYNSLYEKYAKYSDTEALERAYNEARNDLDLMREEIRFMLEHWEELNEEGEETTSSTEGEAGVSGAATDRFSQALDAVRAMADRPSTFNITLEMDGETLFRVVGEHQARESQTASKTSG